MGLRALAEGQGVTYAFARTVQQGLLDAGVITATRGINGGIKLAKPLNEITLLEIFEAAQNPVSELFELAEVPWCTCAKDSCVSSKAWVTAEKNLRDQLAKTTLKTLLKAAK
jgi:Rrf2 family protein